jgi:hypothetical protein
LTHYVKSSLYTDVDKLVQTLRFQISQLAKVF